MLNHSKRAIALTVLGSASVILMGASSKAIAASPYQHVAIISIDGLREADLTDPSLQPFLTNINSLEKTGITYSNASTSTPSDSFPGSLNYLTGASPKTTGVYYDDSYSRTLTAPGGNASTPKGTEVNLAENIDKNLTLLNGGGNSGVGSIDPTKLPLDCSSGTCQPVYPHDYLKTNTIFQVAAQAGMYTAYSDKHPAYDIANGNSKLGPSNAINDFYSPEINANVALLDNTTHQTVNPTTLPANVNLSNYTLVDPSTDPLGATDPNLNVTTANFRTTAKYDDLKVQAILNEISGKTSSGATPSGGTIVPAIFGMNFQALSVAQKSPTGGIPTAGNPSAELTNALSHTDASIGQFITALKANNLYNNTLVILTAKHGQDPRIGTGTLVKDSVITNALTAAAINVVQNTSDDSSYVWLQNQSQTALAVTTLNNLKSLTLCGGTVQSNCNPGIENVLSGNQLPKGFGNPSDGRTPDLAIQLLPGFVLAGSGTVTSGSKIAEHGGFPDTGDATHVGLILSSGGGPAALNGIIDNSQVSTTQVAVTTLDALGLDPNQLTGAKTEGTQALPDIAGLATSPTPVPEPSAAGGLLSAVGLFGMSFLRKRLRKKIQPVGSKS